MAIGKAVEIGSKIIIDLTFNYTKHEYQEKIKDLEDVIEKLNVHLNTLTALRDEMPHFWDDEGSRTVVKSLDATIQRVKSHMDSAKSLAQIFRETVEDFGSAKSDLEGKVQDALGILNAIELL